MIPVTQHIDPLTIKELEKIASLYKLSVEIVTDTKAEFQEEAFRGERVVMIRSFIDPDEFDSLATQIGQKFDVDHNQDMFIFNLFHGIGHFELNLWKKKYDDPIIGRLENLEHDKKVNIWAYKKYKEWKVAKGKKE